MPTRLGVLAIAVFWLVSTTWLTIREIVPRFRTGEPPAFFTDVTDELGGTTISWNIFNKGKNVGAGFSQVRRRPDRTFELVSAMHFEDLRILKAWEIKKIASRYRVDRSGNLMELSTEVKMGTLAGEIKAEVKGVVRGGMFVPRVYLGDVETDLGIFQPQPIQVAAHGNILNTMHLLNKIPRLRVGQSWKVPLIDPLGAILPGQKLTFSTLIAEVNEDSLHWQGQMISCFRIDYSEAGQKPAAHTWVRRHDGLILQQEARHDDMDLVLVREVTQ